MRMQKQRKAKTIRLCERDQEAIAAIREFYGLTTDNEAIRLSLHETHRLVREAALRLRSHIPDV